MNKYPKSLSYALGIMTPFLFGGLLGCQSSIDDNVAPESLANPLELVNGTLKFESIDVYDDFFENQESYKVPDYQNFGKNLDNLILSSGPNKKITEQATDFLEELEGSILLDLLDENGMMIIGEHLYYLDFNRGIVAVTDKHELKEELLNDDFEDSSVKLFAFEDDVIDLVLSNAESTVAKPSINNRILSYDPNAPTIVSGCDWDKCDNNGDSQQQIAGSTPNGSKFTYRLEAKHVYQSVGVYFRLFSEAKHMRRPSGSPLTFNSEPTAMYIYYNYEYDSRKNSIGFRSGNSSEYIFSDKLKPTYYESNRSLRNFFLNSQFYVEIGGNHGTADNGALAWNFNLRRISKGY